MNTDKIKFKIDQLRKDKIIYATEAIAVSMTGLVVLIGTILLYFGLGFNLYLKIIFAIVMLFTIGYWLYASLGNLSRLKKIKKLEKKLNDEE